MANYPRSAYKNPMNSLSSYGSASARGWGAGWPNCQVGKMKTVSGGGVRVTVRAELAEMVANLLAATDKLYNVRSGVTGAYNCRPIAGTRKPSNHSWGMAIDINWDKNPMSSTFRSEIPPAVVKMWNDCGWYWGGFYSGRPDTMHFEYVGKPSDVKSDTAQAIKYNTGAKPATPKPTTPTTPDGKYGENFTGKIGSRTIKRWSRGVDVALVQRYLGLKDDGYFGAKTEDRVKEWQMSQDLQADGKVGDKSWAVIKRHVAGI